MHNKVFIPKFSMVYTVRKLPKACINLHTPHPFFAAMTMSWVPPFSQFAPQKNEGQKVKNLPSWKYICRLFFSQYLFFQKNCMMKDDMKWSFAKFANFRGLYSSRPPNYSIFFRPGNREKWVSFPTCPSSKFGASYYFTTSSSGREGEKEEERKTPLCFCSPPFLWQATGARSALSPSFGPIYLLFQFRSSRQKKRYKVKRGGSKMAYIV